MLSEATDEEWLPADNVRYLVDGNIDVFSLNDSQYWLYQTLWDDVTKDLLTDEGEVDRTSLTSKECKALSDLEERNCKGSLKTQAEEKTTKYRVTEAFWTIGDKHHLQSA